MENQVLQQYSNSVKKIKEECVNSGMTEDEFKKLYFECLKSRENINLNNTQVLQRSRKYYFVLLVLITFGIIYNFKTIYCAIVCNLQDYIYPGLRLLRRITIPIISLFPSLTAFYHETCLIQNPFFAVVDMDCWPCNTITNVGEISDPKPVNQQYATPFIYETEQQVINLEMLKVLYMKHKNVFDKESPILIANNKYSLSPNDMFQQEHSEEKGFYIWKFNNMNVAKILRQFIPRPKVVPKFGQSTERFIIVDTSQEAFQIPDTECSFSFLLSLSGSRTINLVPAEECRQQCKTLKVELKETYLLWYNWWYWRPTVQSSLGNSTLIVHVGSYC